MPERKPPEPQTGDRSPQHAQRAPGSPGIEDTIVQAEEALRAQLDKAKLFVQEGEEMLARLRQIRTGDASTLQKRALENLPYIGQQVIDAVLHYLDEKKEPQPREDLIAAVLARGVFVGKGGGRLRGEPESQVRKSLTYHLMERQQKQKAYGARVKAVEPKLKELPDGRIGRADWKYSAKDEFISSSR